MGFFDAIGDFIKPVTDVFTGGGASLLDFAGGMLGNNSAADEAKKNRQFQESMSSTSHQREVADLRAAGLNPLLSVMGGNGASTPTGATAAQVNPFSSGARSLNEAKMAETHRRNQESQTSLNQANERVASATEQKVYNDAATSDALGVKTRMEALNLEQNYYQNQEMFELNKNLVRAQTLREISQQGLNSASAAESASRKLVTDLEYDASKDNRELKKWIDVGGGVIRALGEGAGAAIDIRRGTEVPRFFR